RGSITFWLDDEAIQAWYESATPSSRGRPQRYSDLAITRDSAANLGINCFIQNTKKIKQPSLMLLNTRYEALAA
ncbi:transposase, partial [Enterobacter asburiae]|uniref:transposase n=1 Tax=Enterobacter asburiae TaxID=61645 RepID=UPI0020067188